MLEDYSLVDLRNIVDRLLKLSRVSRSMSLRANILLSLLHLEQALDDAEFREEITEHIYQLIDCVILSWKSDNKIARSYQKLEQALCDYFYTAWLKQDDNDQTTLRELAYLAYLGSAHIIDALAGSSLLTTEAIEHLISELMGFTSQRWVIDGVVTQQPSGIFKPRWGVNLNYAFAYLLGVNILGQLRLADFTVNPATRQALLDTGSLHRIIQTYFPQPDSEEGWLGSLLVPDVGQGVAYLLVTTFGDELETWPEEERVKLQICHAPETGVAIVADRLKNIPVADENEVSNIVAMSFVSGPTWSEETYQLIETLLQPEVLNQIMRFQTAFGELVGRLIYLLATSQTLPAELKSQARKVTFGLPPRLDNFPDLVEAQANVLARAITFGSHSNEVTAWLRNLISDETIRTPTVRGGLMLFVKAWPHYSDEVRQIIGQSLISIANNPRFSNLWEFQRIMREFTP